MKTVSWWQEVVEDGAVVTNACRDYLRVMKMEEGLLF